MTITGTGLITQSDNSGYFSLDISGLVPGDYDLIINFAGLDMYTRRVNIAGDQDIDLNGIQMTVATCGYSQEALDQAVAAERAKWDANGDGKIGMEEGIRALQIVTGHP